MSWWSICTPGSLQEVTWLPPPPPGLSWALIPTGAEDDPAVVEDVLTGGGGGESAGGPGGWSIGSIRNKHNYLNARPLRLV